MWRDFHDKSQMLNFTPPWIGSRPDGGRDQNCVRLADEKSWGDSQCHWPEHGCMCSYNSSAYLKLKGLCPGSAIDVFYNTLYDWTDIREVMLQGLNKGTSITYDKSMKVWNLSAVFSTLHGTSKAPPSSFTLGRQNWTIRGDEGCNDGTQYVTELKMSGCQDGEFTCNDGQCVSMDERCNQLPKCRDKSDEKNCQILVLEEGYNKRVPPIKPDQKPVDVSVSIDVLKLVDINEKDYSIEIQFEISMKWIENRVTYHNLKEKDSLNALEEKDIEKLWLPEVIYENTDQKETTRLGDTWEWKTGVVVKRGGTPTPSGLDTVDETDVFKGNENSLVMSQVYTHPFQCNYKFVAYPFDTQVPKYN